MHNQRSVGNKRSIKRIYPEMNCTKLYIRNKESFLKQEQSEYHKENIKSALLQLPNFDIIISY